MNLFISWTKTTGLQTTKVDADLRPRNGLNVLVSADRSPAVRAAKRRSHLRLVQD
jgi:hypothetical protein